MRLARTICVLAEDRNAAIKTIKYVKKNNEGVGLNIQGRQADMGFKHINETTFSHILIGWEGLEPGSIAKRRVRPSCKSSGPSYVTYRFTADMRNGIEWLWAISVFRRHTRKDDKGIRL